MWHLPIWTSIERVESHVDMCFLITLMNQTTTLSFMYWWTVFFWTESREPLALIAWVPGCSYILKYWTKLVKHKILGNHGIQYVSRLHFTALNRIYDEGQKLIQKKTMKNIKFIKECLYFVPYTVMYTFKRRAWNQLKVEDKLI